MEVPPLAGLFIRENPIDMDDLGVLWNYWAHCKANTATSCTPSAQTVLTRGTSNTTPQVYWAKTSWPCKINQGAM